MRIDERVFSGDRYEWMTWTSGEDISIQTPKGMLVLTDGDEFGVRPATSKKGMYRLVKRNEPLSKVYSINQETLNRMMSMTESRESEKYAGGEIIEFLDKIPNWEFYDMKPAKDGSNIFFYKKVNDFGLTRISLKEYIKAKYGDKVRFYRVAPDFKANDSILGIGFNIDKVINEALVNTDATPEDTKLKPEIELISEFRGALADEQSATNLYDRIIQRVEDLRISVSEKDEIKEIIEEIRNDEKNHTGKLLYLISKLDNTFNYVKAGMKNKEISEKESESEDTDK